MLDNQSLFFLINRIELISKKYNTLKMSQNFTDIQDVLLISKLDYLYKYMSFEKGIDLLENGVIAFSTPLNFNDPYDCSSSLIEVSDELIIKILNISGEGVYFSPAYEKSPENVAFLKHMKDVHMKNVIENVLRSLKITCFSEKKNNLLMWSHYSRNHTGVCIEFDVTKLIAHLKMIDNTPFFLKVKYSFKRDSFTWNGVGDYLQLVKWLKTKSIDWEYEEEVRLLKVTTEDYSLPIGQGVIKHIYLGSRIGDENEQRIIEICKNNLSDVMISKTSLSKSEYKLEETRII